METAPCVRADADARDELRDLRKLRREVTGLYVFETERADRCMLKRTRTCCATLQVIASRMMAWIPG
jgi:hypothetical protein